MQLVINSEDYHPAEFELLQAYADLLKGTPQHRANGKSTRIVDFLIQKLFIEKQLFFKAPKDSHGKRLRQQLFDSILRRLSTEHRGTEFSVSDSNEGTYINIVKTPFDKYLETHG